MTIAQIQQALRDAGFNPGPVDGIMGALTRRAIRNFQAAKGLQVDGIVGRNTRSALFGAEVHQPLDSTIPLDYPWLIEAIRLIGTREVVGPVDNPIIMDWAEDLNLAVYSSDEIPWCGLYCGHCFGSTLQDEALPSNLLGARRWQNFGGECTPQFGSILVFWRSSPQSWKGHVGIYWAEDRTHYHVLGGNQSNAVNIKRLPKTRLLEARWPRTVQARNIIRHASSHGVLESVTEA